MSTAADVRLIAGLRDQIEHLVTERDALRRQLKGQPGYRVVQHPTAPLFLEAVQDAYVDDDALA